MDKWTNRKTENQANRQTKNGISYTLQTNVIYIYIYIYIYIIKKIKNII